MVLASQTPVIDLYKHGIAKLTSAISRKLAVALAPLSEQTEVDKVTVEDLLNYLPMRYEDRTTFRSVDILEEGTDAGIELIVRNSSGQQVGLSRDRRKPPLFLFQITGTDRARSNRPVVVKWFVSGRNAAEIVNWYTDRYKQGVRFIAYGRWELDNRGVMTLKVAKPDEIEILPDENEPLFPPNKKEGHKYRSDNETDDNADDPELAAIHVGRVPIYRKLGPFFTKRLREIVHGVITNIDVNSFDEPFSAEFRQRCELITRGEALLQIHFPPANVAVSEYEIFRSPAQRRLIFDDFFWLAFSMGLIRSDRRRNKTSRIIEITERTRERLNSILPFRLTNAQKKVVGEIFADLKNSEVMNRLIQGDVGSGKTIVAFLAIAAALENGYQAAMMAPTEILAEQHFANAVRLLSPLGFRIELITGSKTPAAKRKLQRQLADGSIDLAIGTHALVQDSVEFDCLGIAVIDEQHRFGVMQRAALQKGTDPPDILVMTATPIPRSLAMTVYGDLDISVIDELPAGRTPIKTVVCGEDQRHGVYRGIEREVALGRQAYVVYPLIDESEKLDLKAATAMYDDLRTNIFPLLKIGLIHGRMKAAEKDLIMEQFRDGRINILVSTTVIEVGVDVPNASLMVIEHAERFGLSQLHQLRGRVGRGSEQSFCVLLTGDKKTATARERLGIMEETSDGFKIAQRDLEIRGQGELLGKRQSGYQGFKLANVVRDLDILTIARRESDRYLDELADTAEAAKLRSLAKNYKDTAMADVG